MKKSGKLVEEAKTCMVNFSPDGEIFSLYEETNDYADTDTNPAYEENNVMPLEVKFYSQSKRLGRVTVYTHILEFVSIVDSVTIKKIIANRGNIDVNTGTIDLSTLVEKESLPIKLAYGEKYKAVVYTDTVREVEVVTDHGTWTVNFK